MKKTMKTFLAILMTVIMLSEFGIQLVYAQSLTLLGQQTGYSLLDSKVDDILNQIIQPSMTDEEKIKTIYDHLIFNYVHDTTANFMILDLNDTNPMQQTMLGARQLLLEGYGVCDNFAAAFYVLTTRLGFECNIATGNYVNRDGTKMPHAWNQIKIGNEWFWVDVDVEGTVYRNQKLDKPLYFLYLKKDEEWRTNHEWDYSKYPSTDKQAQAAPQHVPQPQAMPQANYSVMLNGKKLDLTLPILNVNGRLMYPFRECLGAMGAEISWDSNTRTATGKVGNDAVAFSVNSNAYTVNGVKKQMDAGVTAFISGDRTYIPIRYAAEALGFEVG